MSAWGVAMRCRHGWERRRCRGGPGVAGLPATSDAAGPAPGVSTPITGRVLAVQREDPGGNVDYALATPGGGVVELDSERALELASTTTVRVVVLDVAQAASTPAAVPLPPPLDDGSRAVRRPRGGIGLAGAARTRPRSPSGLRRQADQPLDPSPRATASCSAESSRRRPSGRTRRRAPSPTSAAPPTLTSYVSSAATPTNSCGLQSSAHAVFAEAEALFPDVEFGQGTDHLVVIVPNACSTSSAKGTGHVGSGFGSGGDQIALGDGASAVAIMTHEWGHNFGLGHSNVGVCSSACVLPYGQRLQRDGVRLSRHLRPYRAELAFLHPAWHHRGGRGRVGAHPPARDLEHGHQDALSLLGYVRAPVPDLPRSRHRGRDLADYRSGMLRAVTLDPYQETAWLVEGNPARLCWEYLPHLAAYVELIHELEYPRSAVRFETPGSELNLDLAAVDGQGRVLVLGEAKSEPRQLFLERLLPTFRGDPGKPLPRSATDAPKGPLREAWEAGPSSLGTPAPHLWLVASGERLAYDVVLTDRIDLCRRDRLPSLSDLWPSGWAGSTPRLAFFSANLRVQSSKKTSERGLGPRVG